MIYSPKTQLMLDVLKETVDYYSADPNGRRSLDPHHNNILGTDSCLYNGPEGKQCAASRLCDDIPKGLEGDAWEEKFREFLKPEYESLPHSFIYKLQKFHDLAPHWDKPQNCISDDGLAFVGKFEYEIKEGKIG